MDELNSLDNKSYKKRIPVVAAIFSIIWVGLGQVYNGQIKKGIFIFCLDTVCVIITSNLIMPIDTSLLNPSYIIMGGFYLYSIIDAFYCARKLKDDYKLKAYNKWYFYILFIIGCFLFGYFAGKFKKTNVQTRTIVPRVGIETADE
ncbi:MAG: hypothetical protein JW983_07645 [Elusimicrobia bacterium]|nr:hypothetical protein [Elusimicrobiota bacterium]